MLRMYVVICVPTPFLKISQDAHFFGQSSGLLHSMMFKIFSFTLQVATI